MTTFDDSMGFWDNVKRAWVEQKREPVKSQPINKEELMPPSLDRLKELERMRMDGVREKLADTREARLEKIAKRTRDAPHYEDARKLVLEVYLEDPYDCLGFGLTPNEYDARIAFAQSCMTTFDQLTWRRS